MRLQKIGSAFKKSKALSVFRNEEKIYIANRMAIYLSNHLQHITPYMLLNIFDIPQDKQDEWALHESDLPETISFNSNTNNDEELSNMQIRIAWKGNHLRFFKAEDDASGQIEIFAVDEKYIAPLLDKPEYLNFFAREGEKNKYIIAKVGLEVEAVIMPYNYKSDEKLNDELTDILTSGLV